MVDNIFNHLDDNYVYYILFFLICLFIFREILIKEFVLAQRQLIIEQKELIKQLIQSRYDFCKNDLNDFGEEITPGLLLAIKSMIENDVVANEPAAEPAAVFNYGSFSCPEPNPKPKPKKQAKPKKKRK
jgi:hypothetical protein